MKKLKEESLNNYIDEILYYRGINPEPLYFHELETDDQEEILKRYLRESEEPDSLLYDCNITSLVLRVLNDDIEMDQLKESILKSLNETCSKSLNEKIEKRYDWIWMNMDGWEQEWKRQRLEREWMIKNTQ